ncbi:DUF602-domain-containing protein [Hortaea werneckii]|uniref:Uncharacterized protein n=1 Tax=Hortaea werneckii TaxID=91943 RepID=A0A3M7F2W8_HORWE|nr:DUF602-domain-containing protein [Hortaea werneckii]KAI7183279.1 DUF602-domain-containing protein [Hortaea werneckii]RMY82694.1 hypothetical protein D0861_07779 [Hortaea werneckii]
MGNDGGSIPTRRELVKEAARNPTTSELKESQHEQQEYHWTTDPVSNKPLSRPIVSDSNGKLYNKDTVLEFLVEGAYKEDAERITNGAIKSLKDIIEVKFDVDEEATATDKQEIWKCPVTGDKLGPGSKAAYIVPCGHAFSGSAIKEVSGEKCLTCDTAYASNDIIPILPTSETDVARLQLRIKTLQEKGLAHSLKKASGGSKKRKKKDEASTGDKNGVDTTFSHDQTKSSTKSADAQDNDDDSSRNIKNSSAATIAAKVREEQERSKKRKLESDNVRSLFSQRDKDASNGKNGDFMTRGYSVPSATKR